MKKFRIRLRIPRTPSRKSADKRAAVIKDAKDRWRRVKSNGDGT